MNKVYLHKPMAKDDYLGRVDADGDVYEARLGPDRHIGRVELDSGKIYISRPGPDRYLGRVEAESGKVFLSHLGPDEYLGKVNKDGKLYLNKRLAADEYIGRVDEMISIVHGGGAFLLLVQPAWDEQLEAANEDEEADAFGGAEPDQPAGAPA